MRKLSLQSSFVLFVLLTSSYLLAQPTVTSFTPASGPIGTTVTINGTNFSTTASNNIVFFGAVRANVTSATATSLVVTVPVGATYQPISVTVNGLIGYSSKLFVTTFAGGLPITQNPDQTQNCFEPKIDSTTDLHPNGTAIADFDGDGKPDLATPNNYSMIGQPASVSILRNTSTVSNISFTAHQDIPTGVATFAIAAGDLNGDGKPDMISSSNFDSKISVFKNTSVVGAISFAPKIEYPTGSDPFSISIADLDLDGKPDLIVANYLSNSISVYRNTSSGGNISFAAKVDFMTNLAPYFAAAGDIDGDGKPDIAVVNEFSNNVSVFRNTSTAGNITFAGKVDFTTANSPHGVAIGDLDLDGKADLAVANNGSNSYSVFRNTGGTGVIAFATRVDYSVGASPYSISIGDINGDGKPEIVVPSFNLTVSQNNSTSGTISFASGVYLFISPAVYIAGIGDLDGDGKNDLAAGAFTSEFISLIRNKNNEPTIKSFTPNNAVAGATVTISGYNFTGVTAVKFGGVPAASFTIVNATTITAVVGNGATGTVAVTNQYGTNELGTFTFNAPPVVSSFNPTFSGPGFTVTITGSNFSGVTAVSFGGTAASSFIINSSTTITAVVGNGTTGNVSVTNAYGTGSLPGYTFYPAPTITSFTPTSGGPGTSITITGTNFSGVSVVSVGGVPVTSFNVNSSTSITATVSDGASGSVSITAFGGIVTSTNIFSFPPPVITSFTPTSGAAGTTVTISGSNFRSTPAGNVVYFGAAKATVTAATATSLTVTVPKGTTFDPISLTVNNYTTFSSKPFTLTFPDVGITSSSLVWKNAFQTNENPRQSYISDLDGDGKSDIITMNVFSGTISVLRNTSSNPVVSFATYTDINYVAGTNSYRPMAIGDINGDGKPDLAIGIFGSKLFVFKNTSTAGNISFAAGIEFTIAGACHGIVIADFDNDSKADIASLDGGLTAAVAVTVFRNIGVNGNIAFAPSVAFSTVITSLDIRIADFDNDGKTDIAYSTTGNSQINVIRNTSTGPGNISFAAPVGFAVAFASAYFRTGDLDGDGKADIASIPSVGSNLFSILRNTTTGSTISFAPKVDHSSGGGTPSYINMGNLDGDGKPDIVILGDKTIYVHRNTSTVGTIGFSSQVTFSTQLTYNWVDGIAIGDLEEDGKPELIIGNGADNKVSVFRNQVGEQVISVCQNANTSITSNITGSGYQWQVNSGTGFTNLANNANYNNVNAVTLQINNVPLTFNNYQYRCVVNGSNSAISNLTVNAPNIPKGTASSPAQTCINIIFNATFTATNTVPNNSTVQLWESINGGAFALKSSQNYLGIPTIFPQQQTSGSTRKFFFIVTPPASVPCGVANNSDTSTTLIGQVATPVITANNNVLTVTNPGTGAIYTWQKQNLTNGSWNDLSPVVTGTSYTVTTTGTGAYRVKGVSGSCLEYSNAITLTITAVAPVPANSIGLHAYPNPAYHELIIDTLNLSDKWQSLKIIGADGKIVLMRSNITNQTRLIINIEQLSAGIYTAILYRKNGRPAFIRFVKQMK